MNPAVTRGGRWGMQQRAAGDDQWRSWTIWCGYDDFDELAALVALVARRPDELRIVDRHSGEVVQL